MNEAQKTAAAAATAALLLAVTVATGSGGVRTTGVPEDLGRPLFPELTDFGKATSLEVVSWDAEADEALPFKVALVDGVWRIPSKHDYPADAADRLGKLAAAVLGLERASLRATTEEQHAALGVVDPTREDAAVDDDARGRRVTLRDAQGTVLADLIVGKPVEGRDGLRYVRRADEKRVYAVKADLDPSTKFADWIEKDLLALDVAAVTSITLDAYAVDEELLRQGVIRIEPGEQLALGRAAGAWTLAGLGAEEEVDPAKASALTDALDGLTIEDVVPRDRQAMHRAGFFVTEDGAVYSNEGDLHVDTSDGVRTTLRFGEVVPGASEGADMRRWLVIDAALRVEALPRGADGAVAPEARKRAEERVAQLEDRFGAWYYVISSSSFDSLRPKRADLVRAKGAGDDHHDDGDHTGHDHGGDDDHGDAPGGMPDLSNPFPPVEPPGEQPGQGGTPPAEQPGQGGTPPAEKAPGEEPSPMEPPGPEPSELPPAPGQPGAGDVPPTPAPGEPQPPTPSEPTPPPSEPTPPPPSEPAPSEPTPPAPPPSETPPGD